MKNVKIIKDYMEKIKHWIESEQGRDILTVIIVILVGIVSFGLGRLSKNNQNPGIKIEYQNEPSGTANQEGNVISATFTPITPPIYEAGKSTTGKNYFASSKGTKYYTLGCSAGKTLKMENRVYFATKAEAESAGYTLSSSCN